MSFFDKIGEYKNFDFDSFFASRTESHIQRIINSERLTELDFLSLLSDAATPFIEDMAQRALVLTRQHFGNAIFIFTPLYISNLCENVCAYCSFARQHKIHRKHLSSDEIRKESVRIKESGIRHILVLTGESHSKADINYLEESLRIISEYFSSVAIEVYPLTEEGYARVIASGVDALTIYQETYNQPKYIEYHKGGPKEDYRFRLEAPERACNKGIRTVTVGALFGLYETRTEAFFTGIHAAYLQKNYPHVDIGVSFPRIRPLAGEFVSPYDLDDRHFVQTMTAMRLFLPSVGITVSTRESMEFRDAILPLGVTKISAGVSTAVGTHSESPSTAQFEIADTRSVEEVRTDLKRLGFQTVMHDWNTRYVREIA